MTPAPAARAADAIWTSWTGDERLDQLPAACRPADVRAGYAVQAALDALAGTPVGWKIAGTADAGRRSLGVEHPLAGPLYERSIQPLGATIPVAGFPMRMIEAELGFMLDAALPADEAPYDRVAIIDALGPFVPAFELPASRFADHRAVGTAQLIADMACAGTVVLGAPVADYDPTALVRLPVTLTAPAGTSVGVGADVLGDPIEAVRWLANELAAHGRGLAAGDVVITGAAALLRPVTPGTVSAVFGELAAIDVTLV